MDPNANLKEQLEIARKVLAGNGQPDVKDLVRLAELVAAMDGWLNKGGFFPGRWQR